MKTIYKLASVLMILTLIISIAAGTTMPAVNTGTSPTMSTDKEANKIILPTNNPSRSQTTPATTTNSDAPMSITNASAQNSISHKAPVKRTVPNVYTGSRSPNGTAIPTTIDTSTYNKRWLFTDSSSYIQLYNYDDNVIFDTWIYLTYGVAVTVQFTSEASSFGDTTFIFAAIDGKEMAPGYISFNQVAGWQSDSAIFVMNWVPSGWHHVQLHAEGYNGNYLGLRSMIIAVNN